MSTAKRRINSTGRKRITRDCIDIRILETDSGEPLQAKASLKLEDMKFPVGSAVLIEAYHRSSGMRFDCGTVDALKIPNVLVLDQVDRSGSVLFRVKVVDTDKDQGKLLGSAERVQPASEDDKEGKRSLFPVLFRDLGELIWKVEINVGDRPKLVINKEIPGIRHSLHQNSLLQAFLLPAALRIVLEAMMNTGGDDDDDEEPGWKTEWLQFCREDLGIQDDPFAVIDEGKADWVERTVLSFCASHRFMENIRKMEKESHEYTP